MVMLATYSIYTWPIYLTDDMIRPFEEILVDFKDKAPQFTRTVAQVGGLHILHEEGAFGASCSKIEIQ